MNDRQPRVIFDKISKSYFSSSRGQVQVLDELSFTIYDRELTCILGPSGVGKSTLLKILSGFEKPDSGHIRAADKHAEIPSHAFIFQHGSLFPWLTVRQNLELAERHLDFASSSKIDDFLDMVGLADDDDKYPRQLSGGMRKRAEIARALLCKKDLILMDEPFAGLDFSARLRLREELVTLRRFFQATIVIVLHDIDDALIMSDQMIVVEDKSTLSTYQLTEAHPRKLMSTCLQELQQKLYFTFGVPYEI